MICGASEIDLPIDECVCRKFDDCCRASVVGDLVPMHCCDYIVPSCCDSKKCNRYPLHHRSDSFDFYISSLVSVQLLIRVNMIEKKSFRSKCHFLYICVIFINEFNSSSLTVRWVVFADRFHHILSLRCPSALKRTHIFVCMYAWWQHRHRKRT